MAVQASAFCPGHVTGFFKAQLSGPIQKRGSLGAGFSIEKGVNTLVTIQHSEKGFGFDVSTQGFPVDNTKISESVVKEFVRISKKRGLFPFHASITHRLDIPVGYGLGSSGAVALSLALALNNALQLGLSKEQVGNIAHCCEIKCKTGLGTVISSYHGGFEIRTKEGSPGIGKLEKIENASNVVLVCFSPVSTKKFIQEKISTINGLGGKMVKNLIQTRDCNQYLDMSVRFAKYINVVTPNMDRLIEEFRKCGLKSGVALFGETVYAFVPKSKTHEISKLLEKLQKRHEDIIIINSKIDVQGARLVNQKQLQN